MSSDDIDTALVTIPVRTTIVNNTAILDIHALSSDWNMYLVMLTPENPGPIKLVLHLQNRSEGPKSQPCTQADVKIFNPPKVYHLLAEPVLCLIDPGSSENPKPMILMDRLAATSCIRDASRVWKLSQVSTDENTTQQNIKRRHADM
ncbi:hypothetical protein F5J12DRAFT_892083 [Pisolithus orientalis]|uniref:uncharacterized protein n=1 Tax=Pisolithus orientalis TaxID=936130 RepID=UPI0022253A68|nr:uncharacterized protein F5J12DRAFT_898190 [Pisolithus orientalis]XP_051600394.1 uncharacterized protein F5J12DRAFT_892083 [Pisolithus orientalis]KAI5988457.1 hypothetical protein F5J12DRAFT_898190 [Pisolithus orientalis]KAI6008096.1 hypothetical protein F5J12DRAFT_892083 [Pisolithus orientalis]